MPTKRVHVPRRRKELANEASLFESALDRNDCFVMRQACVYLLRLLARYPILDREILEFSFWVIGPGIVELNRQLLELSSKKEAERLQDDLDDCLDYEDYARVLIKAVKQDRKKASKLLDNLLQILERRKEQMRSADLSQLKDNSRRFTELFSLSEEETEICLLFFLINSWDQFRHLFKSHLSIEEYSGRKHLLALLGITSAQLEKLLQGRLSRLGIISKSEAGLDLNDEFLALFMDPEHHMGPGSLYKKPQESDIPLSYHLVSQKEVQLITSLLREKSSLPTHVLLYGPAGTGKTSFARALAESLPDPAYEILQDERNESRKRRAALQACLNMTNNGDGSVLIIDEADNLLNTRGKFFFRGEVRDFGDGDVAITQSYFTSGPGSGFTGPAEPNIEEGDYVKLREVSLSYTFEGGFLQDTRVESIDLSATGRNLLIFSPYNGVDPEINLTGPSNGQGLDYFNNPTTRSFQFSARLTF